MFITYTRCDIIDLRVIRIHLEKVRMKSAIFRINMSLPRKRITIVKAFGFKHFRDTIFKALLFHFQQGQYVNDIFNVS